MDTISESSQGECFPYSCKNFNVKDATQYRNFYCINYNKCLDFAIEKDWKSFSCKKCSKYICNNCFEKYKEVFDDVCCYIFSKLLEKNNKIKTLI